MAGKRWNLDGTEIWVVIYTHKHGMDVWTRESEAKAIRTVTDVILNTLDFIVEDDNAPEVAEKIKVLIGERKYREAWKVWSDHQDEAHYMAPEVLTTLKTKVGDPSSSG